MRFVCTVKCYGFVHSHLISSHFISTDCAVKRPSLLWPWPIRRDSATYFVLIGRSRGILGHFTVPMRGYSDQCRLWLCVCLCSKRKTAWAINTKLGPHVRPYGRTSACVDLEVKSQGHSWVMKCAAGTGGFARRYDCLDYPTCTWLSLCWWPDAFFIVCDNNVSIYSYSHSMVIDNVPL